MVSLLLIFSLFCYEDLESVNCKNVKNIIRIESQADGSYRLVVSGQTAIFKKPEPKDVFDSVLKQVFDTYEFKSKKLHVTVKRPETKGPKKKPFAVFKGQEYLCD